MSAANSSPVSFIGYWSDIGRVRSENQDSYYVPPASLSQDQIRVNGYLCIVADGLGGQAGGAQASAMAVRRIVEEYYRDSNTDIAASLTRAIQSANTQVFSAPTPGDGRMGTTIVAAAQVGGRITIANVGDSRAYLISDGRATQITRDHSRVQELIERGVLNADQAEAHEERSYITRAVGTQPQVQVDTFTPTAKPGDVIVLCSDGLWSQVRPEEIARTVSKYPPQVAAQRLVNLANEAGGPDNITVVIMPVLNEAGVIVPPPTKFPIPLPIAAGGVAALVLLLIAGVALLGGNGSQNGANQLAQSQTSTAISIALAKTLTPLVSPPTRPLPTLTLFSIPTSELMQTRTSEPSATLTQEPSLTSTQIPLTDTPTETPSSTPTATLTRVVPTRTRTATPTTIVPPQPSQPPSGLVHYSIPSNNKGIDELLRLFKWITKNAELYENRNSFYAAHPEIHCLGNPKVDCVHGTLLIDIKELQPFGFDELRADNVKFGWLRVQINERVQRGKGDDLEKINCCWGEWVLVRGTWQTGSFKIEPDDFIFVWSAEKNGFTKIPTHGDNSGADGVNVDLSAQ